MLRAEASDLWLAALRPLRIISRALTSAPRRRCGG
jgi:hypothetical protein